MSLPQVITDNENLVMSKSKIGGGIIHNEVMPKGTSTLNLMLSLVYDGGWNEEQLRRRIYRKFKEIDIKVV